MTCFSLRYSTISLVAVVVSETFVELTPLPDEAVHHLPEPCGSLTRLEVSDSCTDDEAPVPRVDRGIHLHAGLQRQFLYQIVRQRYGKAVAYLHQLSFHTTHRITADRKTQG